MRTRTLVIMGLLAAVGLGSGCKGKGTAPAGGAGKSGEADRAGGAAVSPERLLEHVPAEAFAVGVITSPRAFLDLGARVALTGPATDEDVAALRKDLDAYLAPRLGVSFWEVTSAVGFATGTPPAAALVLPGVTGKLPPGAARSEHEGVPLVVVDGAAGIVAAQQGTTFLVGHERAVKAGLDVAGGKAPSVARAKGPLAELVAREGGGALLVVAASVAGVPEPVKAQAAGFGIDHAVVTLGGGGLRLVVKGKPEGLARLAGLLRGGLEAWVSQAAEMRKLATAGGAPSGALAIVTDHQARLLARTAQPKPEGDRLVVAYTFDADTAQLQIGVAVVGMLAAIAIPTFMDYLKKSKSAEAMANVQRLAAGAEAYAAEHGKPPASAPLTPAAGACCAAGGKCPPDPSRWEHPAWQALRFAPEGPLYYSYELVSDGKTFTARAVGDLDCDGVFATFEAGAGGGDVARTNELE